MIFTLLFVIWTVVLTAAFYASRATAMASCAVALIFSVALFVHAIG